ncbi:hypothetical protein [Nostoc sp. NOS(2021)]|uniref:hypothetical protein n=1 Tax=Nostoc sp. NOS(2021) TaxID=2815407 RepID=UPI0025EA0227|nr:hypothetical protein [Nostoc sp. NOS(2021)]
MTFDYPNDEVCNYSSFHLIELHYVVGNIVHWYQLKVKGSLEFSFESLPRS